MSKLASSSCMDDKLQQHTCCCYTLGNTTFTITLQDIMDFSVQLIMISKQFIQKLGLSVTNP